ncbi:hypothetical protein H0H92_009738 [Tricholoma furcatifolium]|nr:hypothetical protein H0H92_009738 [Tricholoma furcatifolium]
MSNRLNMWTFALFLLFYLTGVIAYDLVMDYSDTDNQPSFLCSGESLGNGHASSTIWLFGVSLASPRSMLTSDLLLKVWPAFWTKGPNWPNDGEIDIIEGINLMLNNQMALHTLPGCMAVNQSGVSEDCSSPAGCVFSETKQNSFQAGFAQMGGGVFAAQFDIAGIFIWFFSRPDIPTSIASASEAPSLSLDTSDWGPPSASYPSSTCNITEFFSPQNLVLDITLCGTWAGLPEDYLATCANAGPTGQCYADNVVGSGSNYGDAYFEINYIRAYTTGGVAPTPTSSPVGVQAIVPPSSMDTITATAATRTNTNNPSPYYTSGAARIPLRGSGLTILCLDDMKSFFLAGE